MIGHRKDGKNFALFICLKREKEFEYLSRLEYGLVLLSRYLYGLHINFNC